MIETKNLCMRYGAVTAVNDASFKIEKGEVIGLLGPNGAGKSTTLKIITTYLYPTSGTATVAGKDVCEDPLAIRKMIGYLPEQLPLYTDMEVREYLTFVGKARGLYGDKLQERLDWVKAKCALTPVYCKLIRELSKGYRQRTALAQAILHDPEIVILDEPTSGLDPHQILEIRSLIRELATQQKTIIFSTHILQEVQAVTSRIIVINRGKIVADGCIEALERRALAAIRCELTLAKKVSEAEVKAEIKRLDEVEKIEVMPETNGGVTYQVWGKADSQLLQHLAGLVLRKQWDFTELKRKSYTLEELFLALTEPVKSEQK